MNRWTLIALSLSLAFLSSTSPAQDEIPDNNTRAVNVEKIRRDLPRAASVAIGRLAQDDAAFVLRLPQEKESHPGLVACELSLAPSSSR